jgi:thiol-disulfide isomerase/thioredoxin
MDKFLSQTFFAIICYASVFAQKGSLPNHGTAAKFDLLNSRTFLAVDLEDTSGRLFNTSSLKGKILYVDFWFTTCPPCLKEIPFSKSLQNFFATDTNIAFVNICIDNKERKGDWKSLIRNNSLAGYQLFYVKNQPQKINLLREYSIVFPMYLLVNAEMKIIGYHAPRPSEEGWVHWAVSQAGKGFFLSNSYSQLMRRSKSFNDFMNNNREKIIAGRTSVIEN